MKRPVIKVELPEAEKSNSGNSRRNFLKLGGLAFVGTSLFLTSCEPEREEFVTADARANGVNNKRVFNLGEGDRAILNYAYILEQLEAAFYARVVTETGLSYTPVEPDEEQILTDIYYHEVIHREFFKTALNSFFDPGEIAPDLEFDFSAVTFSNRSNVLAVSQLLEDTGVQAYNGAGKLLENTEFLLLAGKIVSVEARHASAIRDLINPGSQDFASGNYTPGTTLLTDIGGSGLAYDRATPPRDILAAVSDTGFLNTRFITNNIPTA